MRCKSACQCRVQKLEQIILQSHQVHLCFRIAEPSIEFKYARSFGCEHNPWIENPAIINLFGRTPGYPWIKNCLADFFLFALGHEWSRGVGTHSARVHTLVAIKRALVVL